ncbi:MAG: DUF4465 domain-containing protein, partial [Planctomycetes bacterium]|nr:DUF4465 domain-containing protein [Planctomycetota bacterium]
MLNSIRSAYASVIRSRLSARLKQRRVRPIRNRRLRAESLEGRRMLTGPYAPAAGEPGSTAMFLDDPAFVAWSTGWKDYAPGANVDATWKTPEKALGQAVASGFDIVALGDSGEITLTFDRPIRNGPGADFAVFENSFSDTFLELAFVEASSDGVTFFRIANDSLTEDPVGAFGAVDPTNITGYGGKYRQGFGVPFDLEELAGASPLLNVNRVTHVKIVDIKGDGSTLDSGGDPIYDVHPTTGSGGFDLDAVGVVHAAEYAESLAGFEDVGAGLASESAWFGPDPDGVEQTGAFGDTVVGGFDSEGLRLNNTYSLDFGTWTGCGYSNTTDTTTPGFTNQMSAYAGGGADNSATYAVAFHDI